MKRIFPQLTVIAFITLMSCDEGATNNKTIESASADTSGKDQMKIMIPNTSCFLSVSGKDSVYLRMEKFPNVVTGKLSYHFAEKDSNKGDIDGVLKGDTLLADYKFISEGKASVRQVIFLVKDSIVTEGYGPMEEKNGKMLFKDPEQTDFSKGNIMKEINCPPE